MSSSSAPFSPGKGDVPKLPPPPKWTYDSKFSVWSEVCAKFGVRDDNNQPLPPGTADKMYAAGLRDDTSPNSARKILQSEAVGFTPELAARVIGFSAKLVKIRNAASIADLAPLLKTTYEALCVALGDEPKAALVVDSLRRQELTDSLWLEFAEEDDDSLDYMRDVTPEMEALSDGQWIKFRRCLREKAAASPSLREHHEMDRCDAEFEAAWKKLEEELVSQLGPINWNIPWYQLAAAPKKLKRRPGDKRPAEELLHKAEVEPLQADIPLPNFGLHSVAAPIATNSSTVPSSVGEDTRTLHSDPEKKAKAVVDRDNNFEKVPEKKKKKKKKTKVADSSSSGSDGDFVKTPKPNKAAKK